MINLPVEARYTEYIHTKAARMGVPLNGTFELTPCCNMACKMCYVRLTTQQQQAIGPLHSAQEWLSLGRTAMENGMLYLLLTGGEPFLHPQIREIVEGLHQMGMITSINTNGTMINEETMKWLVKAPPVRFNITLYGASDETYGRLCGNPHGFTQVTHAIQLLTDAGMTVKLNCSITPYNCMDLDSIFAYADEHNLRIQATSYMFPPVRRDESMIGQNDRFTPEEAAYYSARVECLFNGEEAFLRHMEENAPLPITGELGEDCPDLTEGDGVRCRAGKCSFWITWEGKIMPCGMFPSEGAPNVFRMEFMDAWEQVKASILPIHLPRACAACEQKEQCRNCAAMTYTETGVFDEVPRYRCQMAAAYPEACRRLEREIRRKWKENHHE